MALISLSHLAQAQVPATTAAPTDTSAFAGLFTDVIATPPNLRMDGQLFKATQLISAHTVETSPAGALAFRVAHRFGNIADGDGYHTLFGLDQAADILLALEYGLSKDLSVGLGRAKGNGTYSELWHAWAKQRLLIQHTNGGMPVSLTLHGNLAFSSQRQAPFSGGERLSSGPFFRRNSYLLQAMVARKQGRLSVQLSPSWLWRNYVAYNDASGLAFMGLSTRLALTRSFSLTTEYFALLGGTGTQYRGGPVFWNGKNNTWQAPLNLGLELETGGHVFSISLSNTAGLLENDFLADQPHRWEKGQFRLGFAILRVF